jgi:transposase
MRSFGEVTRVGVECTGTYGAGLLRYLQQAGVTVLEVTTPDKSDRRKRGKNDTLDAQTPPMPPLQECALSLPKAVAA